MTLAPSRVQRGRVIWYNPRGQDAEIVPPLDLNRGRGAASFTGSPPLHAASQGRGSATAALARFAHTPTGL